VCNKSDDAVSEPADCNEAFILFIMRSVTKRDGTRIVEDQRRSLEAGNAL